jgi:Holliday junction resolvasome RuvABC DNA-binding subunit
MQAASAGSTKRGELLAAMESLGYRPTDCLSIVDQALRDQPEERVEELLKQVLKGLHNG